MTLNAQVRTINPKSSFDWDSDLSPHIQTGNYGENYVIDRLKSSGYIASKIKHLLFCGDIQCTAPHTGEILKIEVKTANCNYHGRYHFCLRKPGKTDCTYSDYVALLCIDSWGNHFLYMVQSSLFAGAKHFSVTSHPTAYQGKIAPFLVRSAINFDDLRITEELWGKL